MSKNTTLLMSSMRLIKDKNILFSYKILIYKYTGYAKIYNYNILELFRTSESVLHITLCILVIPKKNSSLRYKF